MTHVFDEAIAVQQTAPGRALARTHSAFGNMVGPFGGVTAATVLNALTEQPELQGTPAALTINFTGVIDDGPWEIESTLIRTNRTNQHWAVTATQADQVAVTGTALFTTDRPTWSDTELSPPAAPAPDGIPVLRIPPMVRWIGNYEMRFVSGAIPFAPPEPGGSSESIYWISHAQPRAWDIYALAAIADSYFPRVFLRTGPMTPAGTVTLTSYFHADATELAAQGEHLLLASRAGRYVRGHYDQLGEVWGTDGTLLATTHQLVYFKDIT